MDTMTWTLSPEEFAATKVKIAKINERAAKRGFTGHIDIEGTRREITESGPAGLTLTRIVFDTRITGDAPSYGGWSFLAAVDTIDTADGTSVVLRMPPGTEEASIDRTALRPGHCGHCNAHRGNRRYTYLVKNDETGETLQVGSTCIRDFTGWKGTPVFIDTGEVEEKLDLGSSRGSDHHDYTPQSIVTIAWAVTRVHGWQAGGGTRDLVERFLYGSTIRDQKLRSEVGAVLTDDALDKGDTIIRELQEGLDDSNYAQNLRACLLADHVSVKHMGIVVSAVAAHERLTSARARRVAAEAKRKDIRYAGAVGEKITLSGTVTRALALESHYGYHSKPSMLLIIEGQGVIVKTFTTAAWAFDVENGQEISVTGTVKAHEEYRGDKQTVLSRPRLMSAP